LVVAPYYLGYSGRQCQGYEQFLVVKDAANPRDGTAYAIAQIQINIFALYITVARKVIEYLV
jgi:hypothetical protein